MNFKTRFKLAFAFFGYVLLNLFNSILIVAVYILLLPFNLVSNTLLTETMNTIKTTLFKDGNIDPEGLELLHENYKAFEFLKNNFYSKNIPVYQFIRAAFLNTPHNTRIYLEKHNVKTGE